MIIQQSSSGSDKEQIEGLTSAALIWVTAAMGVLAACGLWRIILVGILLVVLILQGGKQFIPRKRREEEN